MFSSYSGYYSIESHYAAFLAPFFFVALIHGIARLQKRRGFHISASKMAKIVLLLSTMSVIAILPGTYVRHIGLSSKEEHTKILYETIEMIPQNASVLAQNDVFLYVSSRADAYTIPSPKWSKEYQQIAKETLQNLTRVKIDYVFIDLASEPYAASGGKLILEEFVRKKNNYYTIVNNDGVMLFKSTALGIS
jgi:uncharacterized membrane protein